MIDGVLYVFEEGELVGRESGDEEEVGVLWIGRQQRRTASNSRAVSSTTAASSSAATTHALLASSSATTTTDTLLDERADQCVMASKDDIVIANVQLTTYPQWREVVNVYSNWRWWYCG